MLALSLAAAAVGGARTADAQALGPLSRDEGRPALRLAELGPLTVNGQDLPRLGFRESGAVSPDSRLIAVAPDNAVGVWDARTRAALPLHIPTAQRDYAAAFSPDSRFLAIGSYRTLRVYDLVAGAEVWKNRQDGSVWWDPWTISFRPGRGQIAVTGSASTVTLVDAASGRIVRSFPGHVDMVADHAFTRDGALLVTGPDEAGTVIVWNADTGAEVNRIGAGRGMWLGISSDQAHLLCANDGDAYNHRDRQGIEVFSFPNLAKRSAFPANMGFSRDGRLGRLRAAFAGPGGAWLAVAAEHVDRLKIFDWSTAEMLLDAFVPGGGIDPLAVFPGGLTVLNGTPARLWSIERG